MKSLLILRHAQSVSQTEGMPDRERPLSESGKQDAARIGLLLCEQDLIPDLILSSTAERARLTAVAAAEKSGYAGEVFFEESFYNGEMQDYIAALRGLPDEALRVLVVSHNPGLERLVKTLSGERASLPAGALVYLSLPITSWQELAGDKKARLENIWRPSQL